MKTCKTCCKEKNDQEFPFPFRVNSDGAEYFGDICIQCEHVIRDLQGNRCELCGKRFANDTLLCYDCNIFLKYFCDDELFEKAVTYIVEKLRKEQK